MSNSPEVSSNYRSNVILITFDSLAAQNMSLYGYDKVTTPHLDTFAKESFVFKNAFANCNSTIPSLISILTGRYPSSHNCQNVISLFGAKERSQNIAAVLGKEGFHISAVLGTLMGRSIVSGLQFANSSESASGKTSHLLQWKEYLFGMFSNTSLFRWSRDFTGRALRTNCSDSTFTKAVDRLLTLSQPFFFWIHIYPPHAPYLPSPEFKYAFLAERTFDTVKAQRQYLDRSYPRELQTIINKLKSRYDELILNTDDRFGTFWEVIKHRGYLRNSIVIVTSDHGEMFEKGYQGHGGTFLYQPMIHIPLILRMPNQHMGKVLAVNAEHIDIAPTLLDILGLKIPSWMEGESLKKTMEASPVQSRPKFSMNVDFFGKSGGIQTGSFAVNYEEFKLVFHPSKNGKELYDLSKDPKERTNLFHLRKEAARLLENMIRERMPAPF